MTRIYTLLIAVLFSLPVVAGPMDEPHLDFVPRTVREAARIGVVTAPASSFTTAQPFEANPAGAATVHLKSNEDPFSQASGNMPFDDILNFKLGNGLFEKLWVSSPSSTKASDGLGPLYNARSCNRCHVKDGRGHPPETADDSAVSLFLRVSIPARSHPLTDKIEGYHPTAPEPSYGTQMQDFALAGHTSEYRLEVSYQETEITLSGSGTASLRKPTYKAADLGYGPLHPNAMLSPRIAPQMIGLGLLEAIPAADILANADPHDEDGNGISGRANIVWSVEFKTPMLGRFGLKAGAPTVKEQSAAAFSGDIGISTPLFPNPWGECTERQIDCRAAPHGDKDVRGQEVDSVGLDLVTFYSRNLGVPARREANNPDVLRGKEVFYKTGCIACHTPSFVTHRLKDQPEQSFQLIWPYSDLLLHDMGPDLADNRPEARADGQEWRTPPLWGIGSTKQVSGHTYFLHDGRARSLLEAVLWHGGEAQSQRDAVVTMLPDQRAALIRFLESL
ncbi:di-heme oxidoredictase family protein [Cohaesibacter celericrescens]|uniref:Thiol oxidoreductase n=1 Tax=Cohaesibacter celericrescens TaxID=2067669 RepID=A0A2N5XNM7_9HYPH|nr:di-heme oxidoredictase family protein [Cohaesibacter celericrescens]PLW76028.1 thiol oxidoreductase [Cohaesibacter celericrescens]